MLAFNDVEMEEVAAMGDEEVRVGLVGVADLALIALLLFADGEQLLFRLYHDLYYYINCNWHVINRPWWQH